MHKSKLPVRSFGSAEIFEAKKAIDEGEVLAHTLSLVLGMIVPLHLIVD